MRFPLFTAMALGSATVGCNSASAPSAIAPEAASILVAVVASPESTITLTRRALSAARGTAPSIEWQQDAALVSTSFTKNRGGPGTAEIVIVAAVSRRTYNVLSPQHGTVVPTTRVELRAWAMDSVALRPVLGGSRTTGITRLHRPRPVSRADSVAWAPVLRVVEVFVENGARVVP